MRNDFDELWLWHDIIARFTAIDRHTTHTHKIIIFAITSQITLFSVWLSLITGFFFLLDDVQNCLSRNEVRRRLNNGPRHGMILGMWTCSVFTARLRKIFDFFFSFHSIESEAVFECQKWRLLVWSKPLSTRSNCLQSFHFIFAMQNREFAKSLHEHFVRHSHWNDFYLRNAFNSDTVCDCRSSIAATTNAV